MKQGFDNILGSKTFKMLKDSVLNGGHPYVEIGGIKWATMNVGAYKETDYGLYFQWGDTQGYTAEQVGKGEGKKRFRWLDCKYYNGVVFTKYTEDGLHTLEASDDAVTAAWGGNWRMPNRSELIALRDAVTTERVTNYQGSGARGMVLTDKTDSSKVLFFPACGRAYNGSVDDVGGCGYCWSSSINANYGGIYAYRLGFGSLGMNLQSYSYRYYGLAVRGVLDV